MPYVRNHFAGPPLSLSMHRIYGAHKAHERMDVIVVMFAFGLVAASNKMGQLADSWQLIV